MKTLDEVIFEAPYTPTPWEVDALHYLKEYRSDKLQWEADRKLWQEKGLEFEEAKQRLIEAAKGFQKAKAEIEEISSDYVALKQWWTEQQVNPPLTWDELKTMEGKPVWVEGDRGNMWIIVGSFPRWMPNAFADSVPHIWWKKEYLGKTWQAYRKERKS